MTATLLTGHVIDVLHSLEAESVNCVVTSPPYWSLRKYDAPDVVWGGDPDCPHTLEAAPPPKRDRQHLAKLADCGACDHSIVSHESHDGPCHTGRSSRLVRGCCGESGNTQEPSQ